MRLDKFLCDAGAGTRSEVKQFIKKGLVCVNGAVIKTADYRVEEEKDEITLRGEKLSFAQFHYYLLHKPAGVITATEDASQKTVLDLLKGIPVKKLFPVGRLDKDTEGLLLITDDGELAHRLLSPKRHVDKTYFVQTKKPVSEETAQLLRDGVDIGDDTPTMPARVERKGDTELLLTIGEGRYHQIKRMLFAVDNEVVYLKRIAMGPLTLPDSLEKGAFRPLSRDEIEALQKLKEII